MISAAASVSSHAAQTFTAPNYGSVTFDQIGGLFGTSLSSNNRYVIIETAGLYLIEYGVYPTVGTPGLCTIAFMPGGIDQAGKIPLRASTLSTGSIVRRLGAQTRVLLWIDSADNNTTVSLPATTQYCNAFLTVTYVAP